MEHKGSEGRHCRCFADSWPWGGTQWLRGHWQRGDHPPLTPPGWVDSLRVLISPQGLVNRVFLAYLASRVLWAPKVSQVPRMVPKFAMSWIDNRGPGARIPDSLNRLLRPVQGRWAHRGPLQRSGGQGWGWFGLHGGSETVFPSVFNGPIMWPLSGWMGQEIRSQTISSPVWAQIHTFKMQRV